ncbi:MAG TPA: hypothetical protein VLT82_04915 [Myxococcaceae bacterium]|nr:hypothetical protein [Myxococcaceae bacterium]
MVSSRGIHNHWKARWAVLVLVQCVVGCAAGTRQFSTRPVVLRDDDRRPFPGPVEESYLALGWDAADKTVFRQLSHAFLLELATPAINVNALDEVPDSSWYVNRASRQPMSAEEIARGACRRAPPEEELPWTVVGAKVDGANPGFVIRTASGERYVLKFDDPDQFERPSAGDVVGSRLYYAAGFQVPCNRVVYFRATDLVVDLAEENPSKVITREKVDSLLKLAKQEENGTYRVLASEFIPGTPNGPWEYTDRRRDDPNDRVDHQDRRELRGSRLLAAWINHHDARSQNTLNTWITTSEGKGHLEHYVLDWGDTLGGLHYSDEVSRRTGYSYYLDLGQIGLDFITFGIPQRPWERAKYGPAGKIFGYFNDTDFVAEEWRDGYPNVAFAAMEEQDGAWMARIIARIDDAAIDQVVDQARLSAPLARSELKRILKGRRQRILERYLTRVSSLTDPELAQDGVTLCVHDRAEEAGLGAGPAPVVRAWYSPETAGELSVDRSGPAKLCVVLSREQPGYQVIDFVTGRPGQGPLRLHLAKDGGRVRVVGVERPQGNPPPEG